MYNFFFFKKQGKKIILNKNNLINPTNGIQYFRIMFSNEFNNPALDKPILTLLKNLRPK